MLSTTAPHVSSASVAYFTCKVTQIGAQRATVARASDGAVLGTIDFGVPEPQVTLNISNAGTSLGGVPYNYYLMDAQSREPAEAGSREIRLDSGTTSDEIDGMISTLNRVLIDMVSASAEVSMNRKAA